MLGVYYHLQLDTGKQGVVGQSRITTSTASMPRFLATILDGLASYFHVWSGVWKPGFWSTMSLEGDSGSQGWFGPRGPQ